MLSKRQPNQGRDDRRHLTAPVHLQKASIRHGRRELPGRVRLCTVSEMLKLISYCLLQSIEPSNAVAARKKGQAKDVKM